MNVLATARHVWPAATAATTRSRRSKEYARAIPAGLQPSQQVESDSRRFGNPSRFSQSRSRSRRSVSLAEEGVLHPKRGEPDVGPRLHGAAEEPQRRP